jgi:hypothetical protein
LNDVIQRIMRERIAYKRLERGVGLNPKTFEWSTGVLNRSLLRHRAIACFFNRHSAVKRNEAGIGIEGQKKIDDGQACRDKLVPFHHKEVYHIRLRDLTRPESPAPSDFRTVRDLIEMKVVDLLASL